MSSDPNDPGLPKMSGASNDKTAKVKKQVDDVTKIMEHNVQDAMKRGEQLNDLEAKTAALEEGSRAFSKNTAQVKSNLWWKNMKYWAIIIGVLVAIVLVLVFIFFRKEIIGFWSSFSTLNEKTK